MMRCSKLHLGSALVVGAFLALPGAAFAQQAKQVTFTKDVSPIFQAKCQSCHEPGSIAPDVAGHLPGRPAVGPLDQAARRIAPDAAMAHRPQRRCHSLQERHVADRRAGRDDLRVG
ncbi:MAG: hypothetical protein QM736_10380 [Vicinamibacterales bacterium]